MPDVQASEPRKIKICSKCSCQYEGKRCAPCRREYMRIYQREWEKRNPEKAAEIRLRSAGKDPEKTAEQQRARRATYSERNIQRAAEWYRANPERARESRSKWREANPEKSKQYAVACRLRHKERYRAAAKLWEKNHPEHARLSVINRRARIRKNGGVLSKGLPAKLLALQKHKCACCTAGLKKKGYHLDHIVPLSKGGANVDRNIQLLCPSCNHSKGARDPVTFMQARGFLL